MSNFQLMIYREMLLKHTLCNQSELDLAINICGYNVTTLDRLLFYYTDYPSHDVFLYDFYEFYPEDFVLC